MPPIIKQLEIGPMGNFAYIVGDNTTKTCCVIDAGFDVDEIIEESKQLGLKIEKILLTHGHFDHARGAQKLSKATDADIFVHKDEPLEFSSERVVRFSDNDEIEIGNLKIKCLHLPGHTQGSTAFLLDENLFTGDVLFVDGIGRCDLDGGDEEAMIKSLKKLATLDDSIRIFPGHNYGRETTSTIGKQKRTNPYMKL